MAPIAALFWFTVRQTLGQRKIALALVLMAVPAGISLLIRQSTNPNHWESFHGPMQFALIAIGIPLVCMIYGAELIGSEVEGRTIIYLLTRRMRRATVLLVRFAAVAVVLSVLFELAALAAYAAALGGLDPTSLQANRAPGSGAWTPGSDLKVYLSVLPQATVVFLAVFAVFGLAASRPLGMSIAYFAVVESLLANLPAAIRQYSILHYVRQTMFARIPGLFSLYDVPRELRQSLYPATATGLPVLAGILVVAIVLACFLVTVRELVPAKLVRE